jgi:hypothetical protein
MKAKLKDRLVWNAWNRDKGQKLVCVSYYELKNLILWKLFGLCLWKNEKIYKDAINDF